MHKYNFNFFIKKEKINASNVVPIYYNVSINKKRLRKSTLLYVKIKNWDSKKRRCKGKQYANHNSILDTLELRAKELFYQAILKDKQLTVKQFLKDFAKENKFDFIRFIEDEIELLKKDRSKSTTKIYRKSLDYLKKVDSEIYFSLINLELIQKYNTVLIKHNLCLNTQSKYHAKIRFFCNQAIKKDLLEKNPYELFKVARVKGTRDFLNEKELSKLIDLYKSEVLANHLNKVLRQYLMMCATGLRISDLSNLKDENLVNDKLVFQSIKTARYKTRSDIPLNKLSKLLLKDKSGANGYLFDCYKDNQVFNRNLKKVAKVGGINKHLTAHTARHTFATLFLKKGGKVEVLKELLNHSKIETTMIYVHIVEESKREQIQVFNEFVQ